MTDIIVHAIHPSDISAVMEIQSGSKEAAQWPQEAYEKLLQASTSELGWVAERDGCIIGFVVVRQVADELEILNLAVAAIARRHGAGKALLQHILCHVSTQGVRKVFLEVRASNLIAQRFYSVLGFTIAGRRASYYTSPAEDALLLSRSLPELSGKINRDPVLASRPKL
ncbi:MAG TPA: ribosomal protein S18-alanine N-acetyltransferase [Verrucomicrobiae bacterium]|nr:ribosomal protein S18-alanine N-acetyltransferase [Verrucomicrobiae bacterium]